MPAGATLKRSFPSRIADTVGISHFIVANLIILLGEFWGQFRAVFHIGDTDLPGLKLVYMTICRPIHSVLEDLITDETITGWVVQLCLGEVIIGISSVIYGFLTFVLVGIFYFPFKK